MIKKIVWTSGALVALLGSAACGGSIEQPIGDSGGGTGGSNDGQPQAGSGTAQPHGGSATGSAGAAAHAGSAPVAGSPGFGACATGCAEGSGCYFTELTPDGICAPFCDRSEQGQTANADLSCSNAVGGGARTCVFSLGPGNPALVGVPGSPPNNRVVTGLCSYECDPLAQDCPSDYTCDITATYSAVAQQTLYACMPNKAPRNVGDACDGSGDGECGPGLMCSPEPDGTYVCLAYCDLTDTDSCPTPQTCSSTEVTSQVPNSNVGVCR